MRGRPAKRARKKPEVTQNEPIEEEQVMPEKEEQVKEKVYWAPARKYALHLSKRDPELVGEGFQREKRSLRGDVIQVARPIVFTRNTFATTDPEVQQVIENSTAFKNGEIVECASMDVANAMTEAKRRELKISSGMVTMSDETGRIGDASDAQKAMAQYQDV